MNSFYKRRYVLLISVSVAVIVALTVAAAFVGANMFGYDFNGSGTESDPYLIESDSDMKALSIMSATGVASDTEGKYYKLTRNVKVYGGGRSKSAYGFSGTLDGNGHTVEIFGAMFNNLTEHAVLKNMTLKIDFGLTVAYDTKPNDFSYIAFYSSGSAKLENVTVDYSAELDHVPAISSRSIALDSARLLFYYADNVGLDSCDVNMRIKEKCNGVAFAAIPLYPLKGIRLNKCTVELIYDTDIGIGTNIDLESSSTDSMIKCISNVTAKKAVESKKWSDKENSYLSVFRNKLTALHFSPNTYYEHKNLDLDLEINYKYDGSAECSKGFYYALPRKSDDVVCEMKTVLDRSEIDTFIMDGFVFAERGDTIYVIEYIGESDEATVPTFGGKYKDYCINSFAFYAKDPSKVTIPSDVTAIGGKAFGDGIDTLIYNGTKERYLETVSFYNRCPGRIVSCTDGIINY